MTEVLLALLLIVLLVLGCAFYLAWIFGKDLLGRIASVAAGVASQSAALVRIDDNLRAARTELEKLGGSNEALPAALTAIRGEFNRALERLEEKEDIPEIRTPSQREALMRVASVRATLEANEEASYQEWLARATGKGSER